ncbi:MAG: ABC transporter substrate-binding protein [Bacteroidota bacterium]
MQPGGKSISSTVIILLAMAMLSCGNQQGMQDHQRLLEDSSGRQVHLPDSLQSVVALRSGALRLLCYMGLADRVAYIEGNEKRRDVPYLMANPELREKIVIGAGNNYDSELLAASNADVIIATFMTPAEADELQKATHKPVFVLEYGDMKENTGHLYKSLRLLGELFHRSERADSLVQYMISSINEFEKRSAGNDTLSAYTGGVAYRGSHGIASTEPGYPPYSFLSIRNVAGSLGNVVSSPVNNQENAFIDIEQLLIWDPEYVFLDAAGEIIWHAEIEKSLLGTTLQSFLSGRVYSVLPYNWYTTNYENILCNTWFIGSIVYPSSFSDVDIEEKCREIYHFFLGKDVYDEMNDMYRPFRQLVNGGEAG